MTIRYDRNGNKRFETDALGATVEFVYDGMNRQTDKIVIVTDNKGEVAQRIAHTTYDLNGNILNEMSYIRKTATGNEAFTSKTYYEYDALNRLLKKIDAADKAVEKLEYNKNSSQIKSTDALGYSTTYTYDKNNRLIQTTNPLGKSTKQSWDNGGKIASKTDGNFHTTYLEYDLLGNLSRVTNALGEVTTLAYDFCGNLISQTDGNGNTQYMEYNAGNKLVKKIDAGGRSGTPSAYQYVAGKIESYKYNADGSLSAKTDRNGKTTIYRYDVHGKLLSEAIDDEKIQHIYDMNGNELYVVDAAGSIARTYDAIGRVKTKAVQHFGTNEYRYDIIGTGTNLGLVGEETKDSFGGTVTKWLDTNGRLRKVTTQENGNTIEAVYVYKDDGSRESVTYFTNSNQTASEVYTYRADKTLETLTNKTGATPTVLEQYTYTYDGALNQLSETMVKALQRV